jgi:gliding motility-associated-like protein
VFQGVALENGAPAADQSKYEFHWYKGQNTLDPAHKVSLNGATDPLLNNVSGNGQVWTLKVINSTSECSGTSEEIIEDMDTPPTVTLARVNNTNCPTAAAANGSVTATVTFDGGDVSTNPNNDLVFTWHLGGTLTGVAPSPNSTTNILSQRSANTFTLQVEHPARKCKSLPATIQVQDVLDYPDLLIDTDPSTNCTTPAPGVAPNGAATVLEVDATAVPAAGTLAPYSFQWYTGATATVGNELPGGTVAFVTGLQGFGNYAVKVVNTTTTCTTVRNVQIQDASITPLISLTPFDNGICDASLTSPLVNFSGRVESTITNFAVINDPITDYQFSWTNTTTNTAFAPVMGTGLPIADGDVLNRLDDGVYRLVVKNLSTGCQSSPSTAEVKTTVTGPAVTTIAEPSRNCPPVGGNGSVELTEINTLPVDLVNFRIRWYAGSNTAAPPAGNTALISGIQGGPTAFYTVQVINNNTGCQTTFTEQVADAKENPIITLTQNPNTFCENFNGEAIVNSISYRGSTYDPVANAANITYTWYDGSGTATPHAPQPLAATLGGLEHGNFVSATVKLNDVGCTSDFVAIEIEDGRIYPVVDAEPSPSTNCVGGAANGSAIINAIAPVGDTYEFYWYTGNTVGLAGTETNADITDRDIINLQGSPTAFHTAMVKSATTKCTSTEVVLVLDESVNPILGPLTPADNTNCAAFPDGTINGPNGSVTMSTLTYDGTGVAPAYAGYTFKWTGPATNQTGANLPQITGKGAGLYTLVVTENATNCISDPVTATVGNALVYPVLSNAYTPQTSCDEVNFPNGQITATATVASGPSGLAFEWFPGGAVGGTPVTETATDGQTTADLTSGDYTVRVYNTTTACASTETVVLPDLITYPVLTWTGVNHVSQCGPAPDGEATPVAANVSNPVPGGMNFTLFYVETREGNNFPTDPSVVKAGTSENSTDITLSAVTEVFPGYITGLIVDNNTRCESQPVTVEIENNVDDLVYTLVGKEFATPCGPGLDGGIDIEVTGGTGSYQFEWYLGVPANTDINFFDNKPDMSAAVLQNPGNLTVEDLGKVAPPEVGFPALGVKAGVYTIVITDLGNQCGIYAIESVPLTESPTLVVTPTDITTCAPQGNGIIQVTVTETAVANGPYELKIYAGNNGSTPALETQSSPDNFAVTKGLLNAGEYYIELVDRTPDGLGGEPNAPCPVVKSVRLEKTVFNPLVSLAVTAPNTSCDPANSADGKITITAKKQSNDISAIQSPQYDASIPGFANFTLEENTALLKPGFGPGTFSVTVTNIVTQCVGSASIPVADQPLIPSALDVDATPDTWCAPSSNGKLEVQNVTAGDFEFTWSDVPDMTSSLFGPATGLVYENGMAGWKTADADHTYYIRGKRIAAADGKGLGCFTPIVMRVVADDHVTPQLALSSTPNTACVGDGEGTVSALATTTTSEVAVQNATYSFQFVGVDPATGGHPANTQFTFPTEVDENGGAAYTVIAINEVSNCQATGTVTVDQFRYPLEIIQRTIKNQLICDFDGQIRITDIRFDNNDPMQTYDAADYSFEWFKAPANAPGTFDISTPLRDNNNNIIATDLIAQGTTNGTYSQMEAGAYYVIAKRNKAVGEGCPTPPYRIDLIDEHENPVIALVPFTDTSCDGTGEGSIQVNVTADATNVTGPFTYAYTWNPNTLAGNNPTGLVAGDYAVTVTNNQTKCVVSGATKITLNQTPVFVTSAIPTHKLFCTPAQEKIVVDGVEVQLPDGSQIPSTVADYDYTWEREGAGVLTPIIETLQLSNYPNIGAGVYYVSAKRVRASDGGPGMGCSSAPFRVEIFNNVSLPNVTLTPVANTACSQDAAIFEGSISIRAFDNSGPGVGSAYNYAWTPADAANTSNFTLLTGPGTGETQASLRDDSYTVRVTNQTTGCFVDALTSITKSELPVVVVEALPSPKQFCKPEGAAVQVTTIEVGGTIDNDPSDYEFIWYEGAATDANIIPGVSDEMILNSTNYPTITNNSLKYFVKVVRSNNAVPARGRGCMSPAVEVNIPDLSVKPTLALDPTANSHCTGTNAIVEATASEVTGGPAVLYNFVWKLEGANLPNGSTPVVNSGNMQTLNNAPEGKYLVTVTNATTNCSIDQEALVIRDLMISLPNIINVDPTAATDCAETGSAEVTQIMIGGVPTVDPPSDPRFSYKWYATYPGPVLQDQNNNNIVTHNLPSVVAGTYFVTLIDGSTSCESTPKEVIIDKCTDCLPSVLITQTAPQINCNDNGKDFTGALFAVASNNDPGATRNDFVFTWYNNVDATGTVFNGTDTDQLLNLPDGSFSVSILDKTTQCTASNYYIIQNDAALFMPKLLLTPAGRQNCLVADGGLLIQQTADVNPLTTNYPFDPYTPGYTVTVLENRAGAVATTPTPSDDPTALSWFQSGLDTLNSYVVTILDPNTGCDDTQEILIPSVIQKPVIAIEIDQPLTNCALVAPNGQLSATADGGLVTGYSFEWFNGAPPTGSVIGDQNKLIGVGSPGELSYTVSVTNNVTGCVRTAPAVLTMELKYPLNPEAHTVQHMTRCDNPPDGWVTASVDGQTTGYDFYWFDENALGQNYENLIASRDADFPDYFERPAGTYTAIVQDIYSGCPAADTAVVEDRRRYPDLLFKTTASFCEDVPGEFSNNKGNGSIELSLDPPDIVAQDITWEKELPPYPVTSMIGSYIVDLYPGKYFVHVVTSAGCEVDGEEIVPTDIQSYNLITQNQDGKNDRFVIDCISRFPNNNVKIFNRSGVLVYEANNYDNDGVVFDGMGKNGIYMTGNVLPVGTYFYIIDKGDGSKPRTGYLELVR